MAEEVQPTIVSRHDDGASTEDSATSIYSPAHKFKEILEFKTNPSLSDDENYMDIVFLITRSSVDGQQGHMGAIVVRPSIQHQHPQNQHQRRIFRGILGAATNLPLFGEKNCTSDIHAEISALGEACQSGQSTQGCTMYITIPPCKRCFAALVAFGITRIVTRQVSPRIIHETASKHAMAVVNFDRDTNRRQMERINKLVNKDRTDEELMEIAERNRKQRQQRKKDPKKKSSH